MYQVNIFCSKYTQSDGQSLFSRYSGFMLHQ